MKQEQLLIKVLETQLFIKKIINTIFSILLLTEVVIIIRSIWYGLTKYGLKLFFTLLLVLLVLMFLHSVIKSNIKDTEKQLKKKKPKLQLQNTENLESVLAVLKIKVAELKNQEDLLYIPSLDHKTLDMLNIEESSNISSILALYEEYNFLKNQ
jgi:Na+-transporting methylmalonyl-CoA/oxaloacetate decarboxylase gamma subunit